MEHLGLLGPAGLAGFNPTSLAPSVTSVSIVPFWKVKDIIPKISRDGASKLSWLLLVLSDGKYVHLGKTYSIT